MSRQDPKQEPARGASPLGATEPDVLRVIADVEQHLARLKEHHAGQGALLEELAEREMKIQSALARLERERQEVERRAGELDGAWAEADAMRKAVEHERAALDDERRSLDEERAVLEKTRSKLDAQRTDADAKLERAGQELTRRKDELDALAAEIESRAGELDACAKKLDSRDASSARQEAKLAKQLEEARAQAKDASAEADRALASLSEMRESRAQAESRAAELERALAELSTRVEDAEAGKAVLEAKLTDALGRLEHASSAAAASTEASTRAGDLESRVRSLESELASKDEQLGAAAREIEAGRQAAGAQETLRGELEEARRRLETARAEIDELRARPARNGTAATREMALRRRRLQRMRELLQERAYKLEHAGQVLGQRASESERVMELKTRLEAQERAIARRAERVARDAGLRSVGIGLLCFALVLGAIAGASWIGAGKLAPATFAARAAIDVDARGGTLSTAQLAEWQKYHENLVGEPQLLEVAADRMKRRGLATLANPVTLGRYLNASLTVSSANDGTLTFELRGEGADRTERVLDTFVTALVSHANAGREHRVDGAATLVSAPARAGQEPLEDQRLLYAAGTFGGGSFLCLLLGGLMWRRLVDSHRQHARAEAAAVADVFPTSPMSPLR